jgi:hypothetical protein
VEGTPAAPALFPAEPFPQAVEVVAEQESSEALGSIQWALLGRPRQRSLLDGVASRGSDGLQSLLRERYPAVVPGDAEGCLVLALQLSVGRLGCTLAGCCYGLLRSSLEPLRGDSVRRSVNGRSPCVALSHPSPAPKRKGPWRPSPPSSAAHQSHHRW